MQAHASAEKPHTPPVWHIFFFTQQNAFQSRSYFFFCCLTAVMTYMLSQLSLLPLNFVFTLRLKERTVEDIETHGKSAINVRQCTREQNMNNNSQRCGIHLSLSLFLSFRDNTATS